MRASVQLRTMLRYRSVRSAPYSSGFFAGGLGIVALGVFGVFAIKGQVKYDQLSETCAPRCNPDDKREVDRDFVVADVALTVGVVSLVTSGARRLSGRRHGGGRCALHHHARAGGARGAARIQRALHGDRVVGEVG